MFRQEAGASPGFVVVLNDICQKTYIQALHLRLKYRSTEIIKGNCLIAVPAAGTIGKTVG